MLWASSSSEEDERALWAMHVVVRYASEAGLQALEHAVLEASRGGKPLPAGALPRLEEVVQQRIEALHALVKQAHLLHTNTVSAAARHSGKHPGFWDMLGEDAVEKVFTFLPDSDLSHVCRLNVAAGKAASTAARMRIAAATCGSQHACLFDPFLGTHEATS